MIGIKVINELFDNFHLSFHIHSPWLRVTETCGWWTLYREAQPKNDRFQLVFM